MVSTATQADSLWLGHVEPDDVVIADIAGQALDIFLHDPESALKNSILKKAQTTTAKCSTHRTWCLRLLVLFLSSELLGDFQEAWHLLHFRGLVA